MLERDLALTCERFPTVLLSEDACATPVRVEGPVCVGDWQLTTDHWQLATSHWQLATSHWSANPGVPPSRYVPPWPTASSPPRRSAPSGACLRCSRRRSSGSSCPRECNAESGTPATPKCAR